MHTRENSVKNTIDGYLLSGTLFSEENKENVDQRNLDSFDHSHPHRDISHENLVLDQCIVRRPSSSYETRGKKLCNQLAQIGNNTNLIAIPKRSKSIIPNRDAIMQISRDRSFLQYYENFKRSKGTQSISEIHTPQDSLITYKNDLYRRLNMSTLQSPTNNALNSEGIPNFGQSREISRQQLKTDGFTKGTKTSSLNDSTSIS